MFVQNWEVLLNNNFDIVDIGGFLIAVFNVNISYIDGVSYFGGNIEINNVEKCIKNKIKIIHTMSFFFLRYNIIICCRSLYDNRITNIMNGAFDKMPALNTL